MKNCVGLFWSLLFCFVFDSLHSLTLMNFFNQSSSMNPLLQNVPKWLDTLLKSCSIKIFKKYLKTLGQHTLKGESIYSC